MTHQPTVDLKTKPAKSLKLIQTSTTAQLSHGLKNRNECLPYKALCLGVVCYTAIANCCNPFYSHVKTRSCNT